MDRSILITLPNIASADRKQETEIWEEFARIHPALLGALLDIVSAALRLLPAVKLSNPPRMADFAYWAVAATKALGFPAKAFLNAYQANRQLINIAPLENSLVVPPIRKFMKERERWTGPATRLLGILKRMAEKEDDKIVQQREWPKTAWKLSFELRRLAPNLRLTGIDIQFIQTAGGNSRKLIEVTKVKSGS